MNTTIQNTGDLLNFLNQQADSKKDWFGFFEQRLTSIALAHEIAKLHADKMSAEEVVDYAIDVNNQIYNKIIKPR